MLTPFVFVVLRDARLVGGGSLTPRAAAPVVADHPSQRRELVDSGWPPHHGRGRRPVDAKDRIALAMLLVVEPDAVDGNLGHGSTLPRSPLAGQALLESPPRRAASVQARTLIPGCQHSAGHRDHSRLHCETEEV